MPRLCFQHHHCAPFRMIQDYCTIVISHDWCTSSLVFCTLLSQWVSVDMVITGLPDKAIGYKLLADYVLNVIPYRPRTESVLHRLLPDRSDRQIYIRYNDDHENFKTLSQTQSMQLAAGFGAHCKARYVVANLSLSLSLAAPVRAVPTCVCTTPVISDKAICRA